MQEAATHVADEMEAIIDAVMKAIEADSFSPPAASG